LIGAHEQNAKSQREGKPGNKIYGEGPGQFGVIFQARVRGRVNERIFTSSNGIPPRGQNEAQCLVDPVLGSFGLAPNSLPYGELAINRVP
jgi:hypothetical protein